jgi:hypothetical protein
LRRLLMEAQFIDELLHQPPRRELLQLIKESETRLMPLRAHTERKKATVPAAATSTVFYR